MSFGSDVGGIEKSLIQFLRYLVAKGFMVDLYLWREPGLLFSQIPSEVNVVKHPLYPGKFIFWQTPIKWLWYILFRVYSLLSDPTKVFKRFPVKDYDIAISYCQNGYSPHYIINKVVAKQKILFYHHGTYDYFGRKKEIDARYFSKYDLIVAVSEPTRQMLIGHFPFINNKIEVINNLVDEDEIIRLSKEPIEASCNGPIICTVGRISPEKGQMLAVETAKILKDEGTNFQWWFVGDGPDIDKCRKGVLEFGLEKECMFWGMKSNPYPFMRLSDVYVQPSHVEADPITIKEAMILKKKIIATNIPALQNALSFGKYGILVSENAKELAEAIKTVLNHHHRTEVNNRKPANEISSEKLDKILC